MIQDISPLTFDNQYRPCSPRPDDLVLLYKDKRILTRKGLGQHDGDAFDHTVTTQVPNTCLDRHDAPQSEQWESWLPSFAELGLTNQVGSDGDSYAKRCLYGEIIYAFAVGTTRCFLVLPDENCAPEHDEFEFSNAFFTNARACKPDSFVAFTGWHLFNWYTTHRYCGTCAAKLTKPDNERVLACPRCKALYYPQIMPAVIVAIVSADGSHLVLTRYRGRAYKHRALVAGFCEIGETPEETAVREAMEECGIEVENVRYYGSQPWGVANNLLLGYVCQARSTEHVDGKGLPLLHADEDELASAEWVSAEDIIEEDDGTSLTYEMIAAFKHHKLL